MKKITILILSTFFLFGCNSDLKKEANEQKEMIDYQKELIKKYEKITNIGSYKIDRESDCFFNTSKIEPTLHPNINYRDYIFEDSAKIYCAPDTTSKIISSVKFGNTVSVNDYFYYQGNAWFRTRGSHPNYLEASYVKADAFGNYLMGGNGKINYMGKVFKNRDFGGTFVLKRFNYKTNKISHIYKTEHYYNGHEMNNIYNHTLKNVKFMAHFSTLFDACPSSFHEEIIIDVNNKLIKLWSDGYVASEDYDKKTDIENETYKIYIPIKVSDNIVLAPWGKFNKILKKNLNLDTFKYNDSINIPRRDLIITQQTKHFKNKTKEIEISYNKWTGDSLIFIKKETIIK